MTQERMPQDGPDYTILVRALRDYSDRCEAPALTPSCPFYQVTTNGPGCGEECMDLLAKLGPPPRLHEVSLGHGLAVHPRPRRPRRGPPPDVRPFDARAIWKESEQLALALWPITAVLCQLQHDLTSAPTDEAGDRERRITDCLARLTELGINSRDVVAWGLRKPIAVSIVVNAAMTSPDDDVLVAKLPPAAKRWRELLERFAAGEPAPALPPPPPGTPPDLVRSVRLILTAGRSGFTDHVLEWVSSAPLEDVIGWIAPRELQTLQPASSPDDDDPERVLWQTERFLGTYVSSWSTSSLRLEWRYANGEVEASCDPAVMKSRPIDPSEIAKELADRSVRHSEATLHFAQKVVDPALEYLKRGRRAEAAAMFDAARNVEPRNPDAHNNYGFCLLPDDPGEALVCLERAMQLGYDHVALNVGNRLLALRQLGRMTTALELAENWIESDEFDMPPMSAYVWNYAGPGLTLDSVENSREYALSLAVKIADESGDVGRAATWQRLLKESS